MISPAKRRWCKGSRDVNEKVTSDNHGYIMDGLGTNQLFNDIISDVKYKVNDVIHL